MRHRRGLPWDRMSVQVLAIIAILLAGAAILGSIVVLSALVFYGLAWFVLSV
jgi:hypothetical protein